MSKLNTDDRSAHSGYAPADEHQDRFDRIDLIIVEKEDEHERVRRLRLMDEHTRKKVLGVTTNQHLRDLFD
jgi:hypothetical protein